MTFVRAHWRKLAVAAAVLTAFAFGRASSPEPSVQVEERIVYRDRVVVQEKRVEVQVKAEQQTKRVVVYRDRVVAPDGTRTEREVETSVTDSEARTVATKQAERVVTRDVVREVERRVEVTQPLPQWRVGALAGFDIPGWRPAYGAHAERRIAGPLSLGVWGLHTGQGGVSLSLEF